MSNQTYVEIKMEGFSPLILDPSDTLEKMLEVVDADWRLGEIVKVSIGPIDMTAKEFEELPEWEA